MNIIIDQCGGMCVYLLKCYGNLNSTQNYVVSALRDSESYRKYPAVK